MNDAPRRATEIIAMTIQRVLSEELTGADLEYYSRADWDDLPAHIQDAYAKAGTEAVKWFAEWMGLTKKTE